MPSVTTGAIHRVTLRIAIQMDPLQRVNIDGDTSFALAETAQPRGYGLFVYGPGDIAQAHTADEWVALDQLERYTASIVRILDGTAST